MSDLEDKVDEIMENHLPHIRERIVAVETKTKIIITLILAVLLAVLLR